MKSRYDVMQWLMFQMGNVGPMFGQNGYFQGYCPEDVPLARERYHNVTKQIYSVLDNRLGESAYLAGDDYSIADIALFPWIARHDWHMPDRINLRKNYKFLVNWYDRVSSRPAVIKGYDCLNTGEKISKI